MDYREMALDAQTLDMKEYAEYIDLLDLRVLAREGDVLHQRFSSREYATTNSIEYMQEKLNDVLVLKQPYRDKMALSTMKKIMEASDYRCKLIRAAKKVKDRRNRRLEAFAVMYKMIKEYDNEV